MSRGSRHERWSVEVLRRAGYQCQGDGPHKGDLVAHHRKAYRDNPDLRYDPENGIALCQACHARTPEEYAEGGCAYEKLFRFRRSALAHRIIKHQREHGEEGNTAADSETGNCHRSS